MLEKPSLPDERILAMLREAYGLRAVSVEFLPLGADYNTAVYRVVGADTAPYFLKLRSGIFDENSVVIPALLREHGIREIIPVLKTVAGRLWATLDAYTCILYPYIAGRNGFDAPLSDAQWSRFGAALKAVHGVPLPEPIRRRVPREDWSPRWREAVRGFQAQAETQAFADPLADKMAAFLRAHRAEIDFLAARAEQLAAVLRSRPLEFVLCHYDIHAGNLLITEPGELYIVDWDNPILAPVERDLMFIGGGVGGVWNMAREEALFYRGYGAVEIDRTALAYYRYERVVEDIAAYCQEILLPEGGGENRAQGYRNFSNSFAPGGVSEIARRTEEESK